MEKGRTDTLLVTRYSLFAIRLSIGDIACRHAVLVAQVAADDAAERGRGCAEQERHERPEREVGAGLGGLVGDVLGGLLGLAFDLGHAALRLVRRKAGALRDELRQVGAILVRQA